MRDLSQGGRRKTVRASVRRERESVSRVATRVLGLAFVYLLAAAHVGSPDTWFEGTAGPYPVTVQISPAGVVPGVARVFVRVAGDPPATVTVQANRFDATGGAPPPESATAVDGEPGLFAGSLWIMTAGSNSVTVNVAGARGSGSVVVPMVASATRRLEMNVPMGIGLAAMGMFLLIGLVTIVGAAVRESTLAPGEPTDFSHRKRARGAMAVTTLVAAALLFGGWTWWNAEDAGFVRSMFKPFTATTSVRSGVDGAMLSLTIVDSPWVMRGDSGWLARNGASSWTPLVRDHDKLMHLFLVRNDLSAMGHLHPVSADSANFLSRLPPLPAGEYRVFADIVHESGFTQTIVSSVNVPAPATGLPTTTDNKDDSWFAEPVDRSALRATLANGSTMTWNRASAPLTAGLPARLSFTITNSDGSAAVLEPYMGMPGHAAVARDDGSVFVHLHPMGTISMASQMAFEMREPGDTVRGRLGKRITAAAMPAMDHVAVPSGVVSFPYAFPRDGEYRIWVQVKQQGRVLTGAFHASVAAPKDPAS